VLSYIPGTIEEVFVKEGSRVKKKAIKLLLLEAMKMMNIIEVPMEREGW
jgi:biotin carboxyl carrier protein